MIHRLVGDYRKAAFTASRARAIAACRALVVAGAIGAAVAAVSSGPARAQLVAAFVNGEPITTLDIAQRIRLTELSTHKVQAKQEALDELIDEKLKLQIAKRYIVEVTEKEVNSAYNSIATRAGTTPQRFTEQLTAAGINVPALKARIKSDIVWSQIVRGKFQARLIVAEKDVVDALQTRKKDDSAPYQYILREVLFIVPRGSPSAAFDARLHEAEALRARFQSCEEGVPAAAALRDVAVREPLIRSSADVAAKQREVLDTTQVGHLTPPEITLQGVETFAVCSKEQSAGDTPGKREMRDELLNERFQAQSKRYLRELRRSAMIEMR